MNCLPCFQRKDKETEDSPSKEEQQPVAESGEEPVASSSSSSGKTFTFRELAVATKNFRQECLLGEGGFGRSYKGTFQSTGQVVTVKQLDRIGMGGNKEFLDLVSMMGLLRHPNLLSLIGHCADGDQRLLVYEFMPKGSLEKCLFGDIPDNRPLDWFTRMKIASGAAEGLEYLHEKADPPIIYRDLQPSNILLDEDFEPKLSDFGLAKLGPGGGGMDTYGYSAPEGSNGGELTLKSDVYSFGVVLLELITGRRVVDTTRPNDQQNLVTWAQPIFRDPKRFPEMVDPRLNREFPLTCLNQAVGIAAMCLQEESSVRPLIGDVVAALGFISTATNDCIQVPILGAATGSEENQNVSIPPPPQKMDYESEVGRNSSAQSMKDGDRRERSSTSSDDEVSDDKSADHRKESSRQSEQSFDQQEGGQSSDRDSGSDESYDDSDDTAQYEDADSLDDDDDDDKRKNTDEQPDKQQEMSVKEGDATATTITSRIPGGKKPENGLSSSSSSRHGNSRTSSTRRTSSRTSSSRHPKGSSRHRVVKFKDPDTNMIRTGSEISEDGSFSCKHWDAVAEVKEEKTSDMSQGSGESQVKNGTSSHQTAMEATQENGSSGTAVAAGDTMDNGSNQKQRGRSSSHELPEEGNDSKNHRAFDKNDKGGPHLKHLRTR